MADELGVAIVGTGFIGRVHARAARLLGARLVGVAASTPARAEAAAAELGAERGFATAAELIEHPSVDVVHICSPNWLHASFADTAIARGKHVVCEKPLAPTVAEAELLARHARQAGVVAAVAFAYRYHPMAQRARTMTQRGTIGPVHLVHGTYLQDWLLYPADQDWRVEASKGGPSRAFADIGSHWCDLAEWMTGHRIGELAALTSTVHPRRGQHRGPGGSGSAPPRQAGRIDVDTEDAAGMLFRATGGVVGTLMVSQVSAGRKNRLWLEVDAADGSVTFDQENPEWLWVGGRGSNQLVAREAGSAPGSATAANFLPAGHAQGFVDCFVGLLSDVYRAVRDGAAGDGVARAFPTFDDGLRSALITDSVLRSAADREWVSVPAQPDLLGSYAAGVPSAQSEPGRRPEP
jgi:predicted dehydrogenase